MSSNFHDRPLKAAILTIGLSLEANFDWQRQRAQHAFLYPYLFLLLWCSFLLFHLPPCIAILVVQPFLPERQVFRFTLFLESVLSALLRHRLCRASKSTVFPGRPITASRHCPQYTLHTSTSTALDHKRRIPSVFR
jgi:hypothetical protein